MKRGIFLVFSDYPFFETEQIENTTVIKRGREMSLSSSWAVPFAVV
jgi:hypothetical protein